MSTETMGLMAKMVQVLTTTETIERLDSWLDQVKEAKTGDGALKAMEAEREGLAGLVGWLNDSPFRAFIDSKGNEKERKMRGFIEEAEQNPGKRALLALSGLGIRLQTLVAEPGMSEENKNFNYALIIHETMPLVLEYLDAHIAQKGGGNG